MALNSFYIRITMALNSFYISSGILSRKFSNVDTDTEIKLLSVMRMPFYGYDFWIENSGSLKCYKQFAVAYLYALKKSLGLPKRYSNHAVCRDLGFLSSNI